MKAKLSYKSKRNIVISAIIVVLIALIGTGTYFFTKSNSDQAEAFSDNGMQVGETQGNEGQQGTANNEGNQGEVVEPNLNQNQDGNAEGNNNQTVENGDNNTSSNTNSTTGNNSATTNNGNTSNNGTTGSTTGNVPNEDYVTERVETEDVLVREDYEVAWSPLTIRANTTTEELEIVRPIISAEKFTNKSTVVPGDEIEYTIVVKNSGKISGKTIVKDSAPTDDIETEIQESVNTTFKEGSIKINGEPATKLLEVTSTELEQKVPLTEQDLIDGIEIEVPACTEVETENGTEIVPGETVVSFIVTIDMPEENEEETPNEIKVEGTVKNVAVVNDEDTNPVYNPIITYRKVVDKEVVKYNEQLKYTIIVTNTGDVDGTAIVSDEAPAETVFVEGSLEIDGKPATKLVEATETEQEQEAPLTEQDLKDGIEIEVPANGEVEVSFIATAKDLEDGYIIKNEAKVNNKPTNETETVYQEPIIDAVKATNKSTVTPGDEIEYTITVSNTGSASGKTTVKDSAPTEPVKTTFKAGSIKINGKAETSLTEQDLKDGIEVEVPARTENGAGETTVSFIVKVDEPENGETVEGTVENIAVVNDEETNPVYNPIITYRKIVDKEVVQYNEQLKYTIIVTNTGKVNGTAILSDEAPRETVFVENSIEIDGKPATKIIEETETEPEQEVPLTEQDLKDGIEIEVPANGKVEVSFIATAKDLEDGYIIKNEAKVNNKPTNETETVYQEPIIDAVKATNKETVVPGDEIEYTITVSNTGSASGKTTVKDSAPTEPVKTTFKAGSIKINGKAETSLTEQDLKDGIEVEVPARTENGAGKTTVSFIVKVDEPEKGETVEGTVENIAVVNDEETNPVYNPIITYRKIVDKEVVQYNEQLKYTIIVTNTGKVDGIAIVSDEAPEETVFVEGSIKINGKAETSLTAQDLKDGIEIEVPANGKVEVSFIATAKDLEDGYIIKNEAKVNNKPTNETETVYQEPIIDAVKATNKETVVPGDEIEYTITVSNTGSASGKTTVKDSAPTEPVKTTFKAGSIKINGKAETSLTEQDLKDGIEVEVPARTENGAGEATVSFIVKVDEPEKGETVEGTVENIAVVNDEKTNPVYNPIIKYWKEVDKAEAKINDTLTYTKVIQNTGSVDGKAIVSDEAPSGTTFKAGSIKINGKATKYTAENLKNGIEVEVPAKGKVKVSFEATVNSNITISPVKNTAKVNGNNTNEVTTKIYTDYRVEYYYGGNTTSDRYDPHTVVVENFEVGKTVGEYEQKPNITKQDGTVDKYKFLEDNLGNNPLVLVGNPKENVIKVYYVKPVLEVTKTDNKNKVTYNNTITYTITVKNLSDVDTKINLSDTLPSYVDYVSDSITITNNEGKDPKATYGYKNGKITYSGTLKANKTLTLKFKAKVNETAQAVIKQGIENIVTVTEECGGSYSDSEVTPVYKEAKVDVAKTLDLILVLDCSNSMEERNSSGEITGRIMPSLKTAATDVIDKLFATNKPTDSTISLITYGNTATTHGTFKYDEKSKLLSKLESAIVLSGNTHIQDALKHTNDLLDDMSANRRKVVLFMSDGAPTFWSSDATSPEVELIQGSGNNNWPKHSWVKDTFTDNTRQKIVSEISDLHKHKKTTVYSVGFNTANLNTTYKQYVEEKGAYKNQTGANDIFWQKKTVKYEGKTYYWISEKDYATYVLNNIATGENYISTSNLITTFNNIVDGLIEPEETYETEVGTNVIKMPEKRAITGKVSVTVGSTTTEYTLAELKSGKQGLKYTEGVGFEWTINQERFTKTLKIKYQVNAE